jgi:hypothetical protein
MATYGNLRVKNAKDKTQQIQEQSFQTQKKKTKPLTNQ